jgi:hypothetical protein
LLELTGLAAAALLAALTTLLVLIVALLLLARLTRLTLLLLTGLLLAALLVLLALIILVVLLSHRLSPIALPHPIKPNPRFCSRGGAIAISAAHVFMLGKNALPREWRFDESVCNNGCMMPCASGATNVSDAD